MAAVVGNVHEIRDVLRRRGHEVELLPVRLGDFRWLSRVRRADLVFNLCEGINGHARFEDFVVGTLELTGVPFTGCRHWATTIAHRKHVANTLLAAAGLPVPAFTLAQANKSPAEFPLPAIVKPAAEDASVGIDNGAVCTSKRALKRRVAQMLEQFEEVLVQEYVAGREFNVGFVGKRMLPIAEIRFEGMPDGTWPIVSYAAKWIPGSPEDEGTVPVCPADDRRRSRQADRPGGARGLDAHGRAARDTAGSTSGSNEDGQPYVLEVNPCPDLSSNAGLARMGRAFGWSYDELVMQVVDEALMRSAEPLGRRGPGQRGVGRVSGTVTASPSSETSAPPTAAASRRSPERSASSARTRSPWRSKSSTRAVAGSPDYIAARRRARRPPRRLDLLGPHSLHRRHLRSLLDGGRSRAPRRGHRHRAAPARWSAAWPASPGWSWSETSGRPDYAGHPRLLRGARLPGRRRSSPSSTRPATTRSST